MKRVKPLARFGLVVCFAYIVLVVPALLNTFFGSYTFGSVPPVDPNLFWLHVGLFFCFMLQLAAIILFPVYPRQSYSVAIFSSIFLLPVSLIYWVGMKKSLETFEHMRQERK